MHAALRDSSLPIGLVCAGSLLLFAAWPLTAALSISAGVLLFTDATPALLGVAIGMVARKQADAMHGLALAWPAPGAAFFVATDAADGEVLGCVGVKFLHTLDPSAKLAEPPLFTDSEASIWRLSVASNARQLGIGRALMDKAEAFAKEGGATHLSLICGNPESVKFYRKIGFAAETDKRARTAMFGETRGGRATGMIGDYIYAPVLKRRLAKTIFCKPL